MTAPAIRRTGRVGGLTMGDGLSNVLSGVGTEQDKRTYDAFTFSAPVTQQEVESAYRTSWLGRKIHDLPPFDMVRAWRDWQADAKEITALEAGEQRLGLQGKIRKALTWARLYGGAALVLGVAGQGDLKDELALGSVGKADLKFIHVFNRHQITTGDIETDLLSPFFDEPEWYEVQGKTGPVRLHPSRVIPFIGQPIPDGAKGLGSYDGFWGDPLLQSVRDALINADLAQNGVATLIHEAKIDTLSIPGLTASLATAEYEAKLIKRLQVANRAKSILNSRILDSEEKWDTRQLSFTGLPDLIDKFLQIVAAAADIPVTRLLGTSAKGLNATGDGDNDNYDEMISSRQQMELRPNLQRVDEILIRSEMGSRPAAVHFVFSDLQKPDPKEEAAIDKSKADTAKVYVDSGLVPLPAMAKAVQNALIEDSTYPGLEAALLETKATVGLPIELFKVLVTAWQAGGAPIEALFERQSAAGLLPAGMTLEAFKVAIEEGGDALGTMEDPDADPDADPVTEPDVTATAGEEATAKSLAAKDAAPRTLSVRRDVVNHAEIEAWAAEQGFKTTLGAKMHVTVLKSKTPVDWMAMGENWSGDGKGQVTIQPGGPRLVEPLGDKGAIVLLFVSTELQWRHRNMIEAGASSDYPDFTPHTTISYDLGDVDLETIKPYRGQIVLGPEIFEEIDEDWATKVAGAKA